MSTCRLSRLAIDFVDDALVNDEKALFAAHLETCAACQEEVGQYRKMLGIMDDIDSVSLPDQAYFDRIRRDVRQEKGRKEEGRIRFFPKVLVPAAVSIAAAILLIIAITGTKRTIEVSVDTAGIIEDENFSTFFLNRIISSDIAVQFESLEDYFSPDIDASIDEMDEGEKGELAKKIKEIYGQT